jgi:ribose transport system substrate-binding protein
VAVITDDLYQMGKQAADLLANAIGGKGKIGYIFYDGTHYWINQLDQAFKATIAQDYPGIEIVAQQGITSPHGAKQAVQTMLLDHPGLDGVYVMVDSAEIVLRALRDVDNTHTKIVTFDLEEALSLDMSKGSNVAGIVARDAYALGRAMADAGAYGLLGKPVPPVLVVPALAVTKANLVDSWMTSLGGVPPSVRDAAK